MAKIALLIGVSEYQSCFPSLPSAIKDVEAMARVLKHPETGSFDKVDCLNNPARQEIEEAIYNLFAGRSQDDLTLFYFSGHGIKDISGQLFLATPLTRKDERELIVPPTAVASSYIKEQMNNSRSNREVIILDCCFSGAFVKGMTLKGELNIPEVLGGQGRAILTSSSVTQYSFATEETELSIYTRFLVEGIETGAADSDEDGKISADELHQYASNKVKEASPAMTPQFYPVKQGYKIYLARAPLDDPKLKYRKEAQKWVTKEGKFSIVVYRILNRIRIELGLTTEEAKSIEAEVQRPYHEYQQKLREYEEAFQESIKNEFPSSERTLSELREFQEILKLTREDIAPIEQSILDRYEAQRERQEQQDKEQESYRQNLQHYEQELEKALQRECPFKESTRETIKRFQQSLQLKDEDVSKIENTILDRAEVQNRERLREEEAQRELQKRQGQENRSLNLQLFEFEVVKIEEVRSGFLDLGSRVILSRTHSQAKYFTEALGDRIALDMVAIPGGEFTMGAPNAEIGSFNCERPTRIVKIQPFFMGKYPVTQAQWRAIASLPKIERDLNPEPSYFKEDTRSSVASDPLAVRGGDLPVEQVSWYDALEFCARLSKKTGRTYRLPSEAEWEYACRAATKTPFHFGETITTDLANYNGDYTYLSEPKGKNRAQTTPVGSFPANPFGLSDMRGNVWEWCADPWHDNYKGAPTDGRVWDEKNEHENYYQNIADNFEVLLNDERRRIRRGGSWSNYPRYCRSACRSSNAPGYSNSNIGVRLVCGVART